MEDSQSILDNPLYANPPLVKNSLEVLCWFPVRYARLGESGGRSHDGHNIFGSISTPCRTAGDKEFRKLLNLIDLGSSARRAFMQAHGCPSSGKAAGACPSYVIDVRALACGGADVPTTRSGKPWRRRRKRTNGSGAALPMISINATFRHYVVAQDEPGNDSHVTRPAC